MTIDELSYQIIGAAMEVHTDVGPGLNEKTYDDRKAIIVEIKAVHSIHAVHVAQVRSYLKMTGLPLGLIINFNVVHLRDGIKRVVNGYVPDTEV